MEFGNIAQNKRKNPKLYPQPYVPESFLNHLRHCPDKSGWEGIRKQERAGRPVSKASLSYAFGKKSEVLKTLL
jgi:hypothetical protein